MSAEEFILIPKRAFVQQRPLGEQILLDPNIKAKATQLSLLQRLTDDEQPTTTEDKPQDVQSRIFQQIATTIKEPHKLERTRQIIRSFVNNPSLEINEQGIIVLHGNATGIFLTDFLYQLQQPSQTLAGHSEAIIKALNLNSNQVINKGAKQIIAPPHDEESDFNTADEQEEEKTWLTTYPTRGKKT